MDSSSSSSSKEKQTMLFRAYIGAMFKDVKFEDVPINPNVQFDFLLSFAIDYVNCPTPTPTNGKFEIFWDHYTLTPPEVMSIKNKHPNVRVGLSLGGDSVFEKKAFFEAESVDSWVSNAVFSLKNIIKEYNLDGIDINYEHFNQGDLSTFVECMGQLVNTLKKEGLVKFVSIAPFNNDEAQRRYLALWEKYGNLIDYVNFQFYSYGKIDENAFISHFKEQSDKYDGGKILASYISDGTWGLQPGREFFRACEQLKTMELLSGIFVWCADDSNRLGFCHEIEAQALLATP